jgi:hypothetical protein
VSFHYVVRLYCGGVPLQTSPCRCYTPGRYRCSLLFACDSFPSKRNSSICLALVPSVSWQNERQQTINAVKVLRCAPHRRGLSICNLPRTYALHNIDGEGGLFVSVLSLCWQKHPHLNARKTDRRSNSDRTLDVVLEVPPCRSKTPRAISSDLFRSLTG